MSKLATIRDFCLPYCYKKKNSYITNNEEMELNLIDLSDNQPCRRRRVHHFDEDIDQITLIWLDPEAKEYSLDKLQTKALLREISSDNCLFFDNSDAFLIKIQNMNREKRKVLAVISGSYANEMLSLTQDITANIIIFCRDDPIYADLKNKYPNVKHICTEHETLRNCIEREFPSLKFDLFINQTSNSSRPVSSLQGVDNSTTYCSYMLFIEVLKQMRQTEESKKIMLNKCKNYKNDDRSVLEDIEKFRESDLSKTAIDWYIKDCFVFRLVNRAFRTENMILWYLFRFYIIDLCKQMETVHRKQNNQTCFKVYRGQPKMSISEFESFKSNLGCQISTNGFFSTSKNIGIAEGFAFGAEITNNFKPVLFEITVDASRLKNLVFVDIDDYIKQIGEEEILFNIGTIFTIINVIDDPQMNIMKIEMEATDKGTFAIKERIYIQKQKYLNGNKNLLFGQLLLDMNQYVNAESYFRRLLHVIPKSHQDLPFVHDYIGDLNMRITNWSEAWNHYINAYKIKQKNLRPNHPEMGVSFNNISNYYKATENYDKALKYYMKTLGCKLSRYNTAITQLNISSIHIINKNYFESLTLSNEACNTLQQIHPLPYAEIINCYGNIGNIYLHRKEYTIAEDHYSRALEMSEEFLAIGDCHRTYCIKALADLYDKQNMNGRAIQFCQNKLLWYEQRLPSTHMVIATLSIKIGELYEDNHKEKIRCLERALHILEQTFHLEYATTANCLMMVAQYYQKQNVKENALKYYMRAIEIQKKIYPKNHQITNRTQRLLDAAKSHPNQISPEESPGNSQATTQELNGYLIEILQ